jgi:hypothetical protein
MKRNSDIEKELKEISLALSEIENNTVFEVPEGYFEALPERILRLAKENKVSNDLLANEEIKALSPLIASLKNKTVLNVPAGYFDTLPQAVTEKLAETKKEAPVFQINAGFKNRKPVWLKYAAAAVVTGIIAVSALLFWNNPPDNYSNPTLSATGNDQQQPVLMQLPEVSDIDLASYLSAVPETPEWNLEEDDDAEFVDIAFLKMDDSNLGNMLKDIPYEALLNYEEDISGKAVSL